MGGPDNARQRRGHGSAGFRGKINQDVRMSLISNVFNFKRRGTLENQSQRLPGQIPQRNTPDQEDK